MTGGPGGTLVVKTLRGVNEGEELCVSCFVGMRLNPFFILREGILCGFTIGRIQRHANTA
jgi:hypothetical protein